MTKFTNLKQVSKYITDKSNYLLKHATLMVRKEIIAKTPQIWTDIILMQIFDAMLVYLRYLCLNP